MAAHFVDDTTRFLNLISTKILIINRKKIYLFNNKNQNDSVVNNTKAGNELNGPHLVHT